jgi:hypothetical protein
LVKQAGVIGRRCSGEITSLNIRREVQANELAIDVTTDADRVSTIHFEDLSANVEQSVRQLAICPVVRNPLRDVRPCAIRVLLCAKATINQQGRKIKLSMITHKVAVFCRLGMYASVPEGKSSYTNEAAPCVKMPRGPKNL